MVRTVIACLIFSLLISSPSVSLGQKADVPEQVLTLFQRLDTLGRDKVAKAKFVKLTLVRAEESSRRTTKNAWLVTDNKDSVIVLQDDLIPWVYQRKGTTTIPASWQPHTVRLESITDANFESLCKELSNPPAAPKDDREDIGRRLHAPGPSQRLLVAHAAWKRDLTKYCVPILSIDPLYKQDFQKYQAAVLEDLAWLHFLRGVNLLMYADRQEVVPHLRLVEKLSPGGQYGAQAKDLATRLERIIAENKPAQPPDESKLTDEQKAELYVASLRELRCPQMSQPGFIIPYLAIVGDQPDQHPPTLKLKEMRMKAVPALIKALDDDTPTRTVYHWRDFARSRLVWRVSDFAWNLLRDITGKDFGYQRVVGFTLGSMQPAQKQQMIAGIKKWYAENKDLSPDDRMFAFFSSRNPKDWMTAGKYFLEKKDKRAVPPLLEKIRLSDSSNKGELCELVAQFGDPSAKKVITDVLNSAADPSDRLNAAIALWTLGDDSGIPVIVGFVKAKEQSYGGWDDPIWFLMRTRAPKAMDALKSVIVEASPQRSGEVVRYITSAISGDLWGKRREPAGCVEICPVLIAAMERKEFSGGTINGVKTRIKDGAALAFVLLRDGTDSPFPGRFFQADPKVFKVDEPNEAKRDAQIDALKTWYQKNKDKLTWDAKKNRLAVKQ